MRRQLPHDEGKPDEGELSEGKVEGKKSLWIRKIYYIYYKIRPQAFSCSERQTSLPIDN